MIIRETKIDDIKAARDAWEKDFELAQKEYDQQERDYDNVLYTLMENIETEIKNELSDLDTTNLLIQANPYGARFGSDFRTEIRFTYGERSDNKISLKWDAEFSLDNDGNVKKETGSWSGLEATTPELLNDLKNSVKIIERIVNMNWQDIILDAEAKRPNRKDYVKKSRPDRGTRPDFEQQIVAAEIEDAIQTGKLIKGNSVPALGYRYTTRGYYKIWSETPKRFNISFIPERYIENRNVEEYAKYIERELAYTQQVNKDNLYKNIVQPVETVEL